MGVRIVYGEIRNFTSVFISTISGLKKKVTTSPCATRMDSLLIAGKIAQNKKITTRSKGPFWNYYYF